MIDFLATHWLFIWFGLGLILAPFSYAITFAYFQREYTLIAKYDKRKDMSWSLFYSFLTILSPTTFIVILCLSGFLQHGLKWK